MMARWGDPTAVAGCVCLLGQRLEEGHGRCSGVCSLQGLTWGWVSQEVIIPDQTKGDQITSYTILRFQPWRPGGTQGIRDTALETRRGRGHCAKYPNLSHHHEDVVFLLPIHLGTILGRRHGWGGYSERPSIFILMSDSFLIWGLNLWNGLHWNRITHLVNYIYII